VLSLRPDLELESSNIMKRYLNPKNDLPFKRIFGEHPELPENEDISRTIDMQ
jgi:hypothetical protein